MTNVGSLNASMALQSAAFDRNLQRAAANLNSQAAQMNRSMQGVQRASQQMARQLDQARTGIMALAGVMAVRQFQQFTRSALQSADAIAKAADAVQLSTKALQQNRVAFGLAGVSAERFDKSMERFVRNLGDARQGTGALASALKATEPAFLAQLNAARGTEEALNLYLQRLAQAPDAAARATLAAAAFGREGVRMAAALKDGTAGLDAMRRQAVDLGLVLEDRLLRQAEAVNDRMTILRGAFDVGMQRSIIQGLAGSFELTAENIEAARRAGEEFGRVVGQAMRAVAAAGEFAARNMRLLVAAGAALIGLKLGAMVAAMVPPFLALARALRAAAMGQALFAAAGAKSIPKILVLAAAAGAAVAAFEALADPVGRAIDEAEALADNLLNLNRGTAEMATAVARATDETDNFVDGLRAENAALAQLKMSYVDFGKALADAEFDRDLYQATVLRGIKLHSVEGQWIARELEYRRELQAAIDGETAARERQADAVRAEREAMEEAARRAEQAWRHTTDRIVDFWADSWASVLDGNLRDAGQFAEQFKSLMLRTFAQVSANAVIRPILQGSGLAGAGGPLSGAGSMVGLGLGALGSANQSPLTSGLGAFSTLLQGGSTFGTQALAWGASAAPQTLASMGLLQPATGFYNSGIAGSGYVASQLGSTLAAGINAAPWGAFGTLGMQLLGFESRDPLVGAGLGIAGSIGGGMVGSAALGAALGTAAGPAGAIVGAALAQVLSSQIGPNASVGPNASASLGFGVGASGRDNDGDAAPFVAGIQQVADALNAIMAAAGLRVADPGQSFWRFGLGTVGTSPFGQDPGALLAQVLTSGALAADNPDVARALARTGGDVQAILGDLAFAADFADALAGMRQASLDFAQVLEIQVRRQVEDQVAALKAFADQTARLGLDTDAATAAMRDYVRAMVGLTDMPEALTPVEAALTGLRVQFEALGPMLDQVGISAGEAQAGLARMQDQIRVEFTRGLQADINEAMGFGAVNAVAGLLEAADLNRRSAVAAGADVSLVDRWLDARIRAELSRADEAGLLAVLSQLADSPRAVQLAGEALEELRLAAAALADQAQNTVADMAAVWQRMRDEQAAGLRAMADEAGRAAERFDGFARSLAGFRQDLLVGPLSPLSSANQLAAARDRLTGLQGGLAAGDLMAFEDLQGAVRQFLEASRAFNASGPGFASDFALAQDLLAQSEAMALAEAQRQREIEAATLRSLDELRGIRGVLETLSQPLIDFARLGSQVLAGAIAQPDAIAAQHKLLAAMSPDELAVAMGMMATGGQGQAFARQVLGSRSFDPSIQAALVQDWQALSAQVSAGAIAQPDAIARQREILSRADAATLQQFLAQMNPMGANTGMAQDWLRQMLGMALTNVPGFSSGGVTGTMARLHDGELFYTGPPGRVFSSPELAGLEIGPAGSSGGGEDLRAEVAALNRRVDRLIRIIAEGMTAQVQAVERGNRQRDALARDQRLAGYQDRRAA